MSSDEIAIRVENLSKCYQIYDRPQDRLKQFVLPRLSRCVGRQPKAYFQEFWALRDVSFEVRKGETVAVIGRNGSGKSTLLQIICGTLSQTGGTVQTNGRVAALLELGAGFNPEFTGRENVYMNGSLLGLTTDEIDVRFDSIAAFADIGDFINQPVKTYSSGMFARLAFAVASHVDPEILIVDEILAVGDAVFQRKCMKRFYELKDSGCSILLVAHDQYLVRSSCHKAIYLKQGRMVTFGPSDEVSITYHADLGLAQEEAEIVASEEVESPVAIAPTEPNRSDKLFEITDVELLTENGAPTSTVRCGDNVFLKMRFVALSANLEERVSFVFNLYTQEGLYVCGTTTLMEGMPPELPGRRGSVTITFPNIPLLQGKYIWRVAINDDRGLLVHAEAKGVCPFTVVDDFKSVGLINLSRSWSIAIEHPGCVTS